MLDAMEIKSEARLRWFELLKRESGYQYKDELPGGRFMNVARGKLEEEVAEEGLDADIWSAVVNPKSVRQKQDHIFRKKEKYTFIVTVH